MKYKNLFFLILGFLIGQGSMFLVQTYLAINGRFELIAKVGISLGLLSLTQWISDFGGVYLLSRKLGKGENPFTFIKFRLFLAILFSVILIFICKLINLDLFYREVFYFAPLISIVWAVNITGVLDYLCKNKIAGPISGLPWFLCALYIWISDKYFEISGFYLGASYFFGVFLVTLVQLNQLSKSQYVKFWNLQTTYWQREIKDMAGYTLAFSMSQVYGRLIPILVQTSIGGAVAGYYVYGKSFTNISAQFVSFLRRVEFSSLLKNDKFTLNFIYKGQKLSVLLVTAFFISFLFLSILNYFFSLGLNKQLSESLFVIVFLQGIQIIWLIPSLLGQYCIAKGKIWSYAKIQLSSSILSIFVIYSLIEYINVYAIFISEVFMYLLQIYFYIKVIGGLKWK